jgi:hypothetical protein
MIVVDIELRFVEREHVERLKGTGPFAYSKIEMRRILQMRKLVRRPIPGPFTVIGEGYGPEEWTDWQDVPLVKE